MKLLLLLLIMPTALPAQIWQQLEDFPGSERDDGVCFTIDEKAYCGTGFDAGFQSTRDFYSFDFSTESWSPIAALPFGKQRQYATSFVFNNQGYVFGGIDSAGNYLNDLWCYSPVSNAWTQRFGLPAPGRSGASVFVLSDTAYVVGGKTASSEASSDVWAYVISSNGWLKKADLPEEIWRGIAYAHAGKGYAGLGRDNGGQSPNTEIYRYSPVSNSWAVVPELYFEERTYALTASTGNFVYLFAGEGSSGYLSTLKRINMLNLTVDDLTDFPDDARRGGSAFTNGEDFFTINGVTATQRQRETWVARGALNVAESNEVDPLKVWVHDAQIQVQANDFKQLELFDCLGRRTLHSFQPSSSLVFLDKGVYFYRVQAGERSFAGKVYVD